MISLVTNYIPSRDRIEGGEDYRLKGCILEQKSKLNASGRKSWPTGTRGQRNAGYIIQIEYSIAPGTFDTNQSALREKLEKSNSVLIFF